MKNYKINKNYYNRNSEFYENSSWYYFNKYKNREVEKELMVCVNTLRPKNVIRILELGPGTGYLLNKLIPKVNSAIEYEGWEHSTRMAYILRSRFNKSVNSFVIKSNSITSYNFKKRLSGPKVDFIIGSSILHHLPDYPNLINLMASILKPGGVMYFVREPIYRDECEQSNLIKDLLSFFYEKVNNLLMCKTIRQILWPKKIKAEDATNVAILMFKSGVSMSPFIQLEKKGFSRVLHRRYNRRASSLFSYIENKWLSFFRKDIFGNTLFSIAVRKSDK